MHGLSRTRQLLGLAFLGFFASIQVANGQNKSEKVNFETGDGVRIVGNYWGSSKGKKAPVVLLLHDFKAGKGGNSHADGWDSLAEALNKDGYAVLSFDFRGHGDSTTVNPNYWMHQHNIRGQQRPPNLSKPPETVSHATFNKSYFTSFVNDIAAARAFIDRKNDGGELNSSNVIVIGAGEGATLGALWMMTEWRKARAGQAIGMGLPKINTDPEGKDLVCAVWLDISPTIADVNMPVTSWLSEVGRKQKINMGFIFGKEVAASNERAGRYLVAIIPNFERGKPSKEPAYELTGEKALPTKLTGSQLLNKNLETEKFIVNDYLKVVMEKNQVSEWRNKDSQNSQQFWIFPGVNPYLYPAKNVGELAPLPIPLTQFMK